MAYTHQIEPLPTLPARGQELLSALMKAGFRPDRLSPTFTPLELVDLLSSPALRAHLAALLEGYQLLLALRGIDARETAIEVLQTVSTRTPDLIERRRAATTLLRAVAAPPRARSAKRPARPSPDDPADPEVPAPQPSRASSHRRTPPASPPGVATPAPPREPAATPLVPISISPASNLLANAGLASPTHPIRTPGS